MKKWLLAVLPATALAAPPQGFYQNYQDWDIACDNTGTCRLAGYQAEETETPVSILFTRQAGANAAVAGEVSLLPLPAKFPCCRLTTTSDNSPAWQPAAN